MRDGLSNALDALDVESVSFELRQLRPAESDEEEELVARAEQLLADVEKASEALSAARGGSDAPALQSAIEAAEVLGSRAGIKPHELTDARKRLETLRSLDQARAALNEQLDKPLPTEANQRDQSLADLNQAKSAAVNLGLADGALFRRVERHTKRLEMLSNQLLEYEEISLGRRFNRGGGSGAAMHDATYRGWEGAAKVWKVNADEGQKKKIMRELAALSRAQGAHVVGLLGIAFRREDHGEIAEIALLMEKVSSVSLSALVHDKMHAHDDWPLSPTAVSSIALCIARGMKHLHALGGTKPFLHHDLKSDNIMVVEPELPERPWSAKIIDFGEAEGTGMTMTITGRHDTASVGTVGYMAPEQEASWTKPRPNHRRCDEASEVFSFAVILWEMLTRMRPTTLNRLDVTASPFPVPAAHKQLIEVAGTADPLERLQNVGGNLRSAFEWIVVFLTDPAEQSMWKAALKGEIDALSAAQREACFKALGGPRDTLASVLGELPTSGLDEALRVQALQQIKSFFRDRGLEAQAQAEAGIAQARAIAFPQERPQQSFDELCTELTGFWTQLRGTYCPPPPAGPEQMRSARHGRVLLIITPGFNPCAYGKVGEPAPVGSQRASQWEWEGFTVKTTATGMHDDPNSKHGHEFNGAIDRIAADVAELLRTGTPAANIALLAGSRGGGLLSKRDGVWDRMRLPSGDPKRIEQVGCFVLNVGPEVDGTRLPEGIPLTMTYGSHEGRYMLVHDDNSNIIGGGGKHPPGFASFIRKRGFLEAIPPKDSLEGLLSAQPGSRTRRFIYYKGDQSSVPSNEWKDKWNALRQTPEALASWPRPPIEVAAEWPPEDVAKLKWWREVQKPEEPPPFLGAAFVPKVRLSTFEVRPTAGPHGDGHDPASLYHDHCLLRLLDAALSPQPEVAYIASWRQLLPDARQEAEAALGNVSEALRAAKELNAFGAVPKTGAPPLAELLEDSDERQHVEAIFFSSNRCDYHPDPKQKPWSASSFRVVKVERVQNAGHLRALSERTQAIKAALAEHGIAFAAGVHTRWLFHGAPHAAIASVISEPVSGFQAIMGARDLWGKGIYLARDAAYPFYGTGTARFCHEEGGVYKILLCLVVTGLSCAGDADMKLKPFFRKPMRYHSSVDSMAHPQIFIVNEGVAVCPAYVISFTKRG